VYTETNWYDHLPMSPSRWNPPQRPADLTESRLIEAILDGHFPVGSNLPGERELAEQLGITRPTLREALQRLARDGWLDIHQGRPTRVQVYWREGNLGVLGAIARHPDHTPQDFVANLLRVRMTMAPAYASAAVAAQPEHVAGVLEDGLRLEDAPEPYAQFDWRLHHELTLASSNPVFTLILNGFRDLYLEIGPGYFRDPRARIHSHNFYEELYASTQAQDHEQAEQIVRRVMRESLELWLAMEAVPNGGTE
jgi:GntR family negative regulator for fad regulon and positive regulator of fabA